MSARNSGARDLKYAVDELGERLPPALRGLAHLAYNYRWAWLEGAAELFCEIDPAAWRRSECNPRYVLEAASPRRLREVAGDEGFVGRVQQLTDALDADLGRPPIEVGSVGLDAPVAYFCSEFGIHCSLPLYSGGLGVLAGDLLKAASDLAVPLVGVGLLYRQGYFNQRLDPLGWQHEYWVSADFDRLPVVRVTGAEERPLTVEVRLRGRVVQVQVWRVDVGRVPLYLLDTDIEENDPIDRWITSRLYVGDRLTRLAQYAVLGVGGVRALTAMGIQPGLVHLNEGHAALSGAERMREAIATGGSVADALDQVRQQTVFTTHTPVAAGNEGYDAAEADVVLRDTIEDLGLPRETFDGLARAATDDAPFGLHITPLALRTSRASNGVSRRHGKVAREMWKSLWPARAVEGVPIRHVTNGVHTSTWMAAPMRAVFDRHLGPEWRTRLADASFWEGVLAIPDGEIWGARCAQREALVHFVRSRSVTDRLARGESHDYVEQAARVFDPGTLTIGFARRVATYKRLHLLTRFPERGIAMLGGARPVQILVAGKAHPQDQQAKEALHDVFGIKQAPGVGGRVAYLENYDLHMAPRLVAGVDVWLNVPRPPLEASGTSGMKVAVNGGLNLSVLDGWWAEAFDGTNGWGITTPDGDREAQDDHDAGAVLDLLEGEVLPLFYERETDGIPHRWIERVKHMMATLIPRFSAERMVRDYLEVLYAPTAESAWSTVAPDAGDA